MPDLDLAELDRLHAEATPGPWHLYRQFVITDGTETKHFTFVYWLANNKGSRTEQNARNAAAIAALHNAYPSLRARIAELERKAKAFDEIRELFDRFDTRFAGARDQVLLTDDLLERTRDAISAAVAAKESKHGT